MSSSSSSSGGGGGETCEDGYTCKSNGKSASCTCLKCDEGYKAHQGQCVPKGNNGVGNGEDGQPPGDPPVNDGPGTAPGSPGNKGGANK